MAGIARSRLERRLEAARGYLALDMPDHALRELRAVSDDETAECDWHRLRGEALRQRGDYESALDSFSIVLAEDENDVSVLMGMAWCYKRIDRLDDAIRMKERAYRAAREEPIVLYNLACYHALDGNKQQCLSWLGRALRMESALRRLIPSESDFDRLRDDPDFQFVTGQTEHSDAR